MRNGGCPATFFAQWTASIGVDAHRAWFLDLSRENSRHAWFLDLLGRTQGINGGTLRPRSAFPLPFSHTASIGRDAHRRPTVTIGFVTHREKQTVTNGFVTHRENKQ